MSENAGAREGRDNREGRSDRGGQGGYGRNGQGGRDKRAGQGGRGQGARDGRGYRGNREGRPERDGNDGRARRDGRGADNRDKRDNRGGRPGRAGEGRGYAGDKRGDWSKGPRRFDERKPRFDKEGRAGEGRFERRDDRPPRTDREGRENRPPRADRENRPNEREGAPKERFGGNGRSFGGERRSGQDTRRPRGGKADKGPSAGRKTAHRILGMLRERDAFARDLLAKHVDASSMSREDRAFATKLVLGVVSAQGTLDEVIDRCLDAPEDVQPDVRDALRIGAYELLFLDKTAYAAVNEGVELVRSFSPRAARLANAVLRKVSAEVEEFPFGDPDCQMEAFARKHAFPQWLATLLLHDLGLDAARDFMTASNEPAPLFVAVNAAKGAADEVLSVLEVSKGAPEPVLVNGVETPGCYRVAEGRVLFDGPVRALLEEGRIIVSDAAAQTVACVSLPEDKPASLLEIGAGRGTKTVLLQSHALMKYGSQIENYVTVDNLAFKTKILADRVAQCGISVAECLTGDGLALADTLGERTFDMVFVDAPCSGLGTLRRHPEIRWRLAEESVCAMAEQGLSLLQQAAAHVVAGGTLVYATCTVTHEENNAVVRRFLNSPEGEGFSLAPIREKGCLATRLASGTPDAHFAVRFVRSR